MKKLQGVAAALAAMSMLASVPASAEGVNSAEKLRRLDIMLMVTGLRCRTTVDNFQADYGSFTTNHLTELNAASDALKADFAARYGAAGANRALDRMSTTMANAYGGGHPWLSCSELKMIAQGLANAQGTAPLEAAADQLLGEQGTAQLALARF
ncbi:MAG TPA: S-adenosyl-L-homocysteine hydrolase [Novosphingobium sp.]|nr:S-adenosyl-L-homocysteine hydrolase [Novosphingobium sp.]